MKLGFFYPWGEDIDAKADSDWEAWLSPQLNRLHPRILEMFKETIAEMNICVWPTDGSDGDNPDDCRLVIAAFGPDSMWASNIDLAEALKVGLADYDQCGPGAELTALRKLRVVVDEAIAARVAATQEGKE